MSNILTIKEIYPRRIKLIIYNAEVQYFPCEDLPMLKWFNTFLALGTTARTSSRVQASKISSQYGLNNPQFQQHCIQTVQVIREAAVS